MTIARNSTAWYAALDAHVAARSAVPFAWGSNDCCTFAADWVCIALEGSPSALADPMHDLRGLVEPLQAYRALEDLGGMLAAVTARMGPPIAGTMAQVGDLCMVRHGAGRLSMGVCLGPHVAAPGELGLLMVPITQAEAAWRV